MDLVRLALLELLVCPEGLPLRKSQQPAWEHLQAVGWARRTGRQDRLRLSEPDSVRQLLDRVWPEWPEFWAQLQAHGLSPDERGERELQRLHRQQQLAGVQLPARLNQRTALAAVAAHSKASLTPVLAGMLAEVRLTRDGLVRLRPHAGLMVEKGPWRLEGALLADLTGEVILTERALSDGTRLTGPPPRAILSIENRGPYVDLALPEGWLAVHVAGWDSSTMALLAAEYPQVPWFHFGDLDPNGLAIYRHLRGMCPNLGWFVPEFWREWLERGQRGPWPQGLAGPEDPPLVRELAEGGRWLEQEAIVLDERLGPALESARI